jgi:predicted metal-dependent hydrolase
MHKNDQPPVAETVRCAVSEFNQREFFQCHETLEALWHRYDAYDRECIQGIIQIAVGYYHFLRGNNIGALKLLTRGTGRVLKFTPECFGIDTRALSEAVSNDIERLRCPQDGEQITLSIPLIRFVSN